jgi:ketosteroid isomerase-like protein
MGAQDTTDAFFELLNADDRAGALTLFDERVEMRVHVAESVQLLKGRERVGGWFLRADKGLRMIPGEVKDTGHQVECDILVVRPGSKSSKIDATFKVEAGKITAINFSPRDR